MKIKIIILSLSFSMCGNQQTKNLPELWIVPDVIMTGATSNGKTLVAFHGLNGTPDDLILNVNYIKLLNKYIGEGYRIILPQIPRSDKEYWEDGGMQYRLQFLQKMQTLKPDAVLGVSYGGLHALMLAESFPVEFWIAILPVIDIGALTEYIGEHAPEFIPTAEKLCTVGFLAWSDNDERVNFRLTEALASGLTSCTVVTKTYQGTGHSVGAVETWGWVTK